MLYHYFLLVALPGCSAGWLKNLGLFTRGIKNSTDDWTTVDRLDLYQSLVPCAQSCVREVNQNISMGSTYCQTYGCVCAESTRGPNFVTGLESVRECAKRKCFSEKDVKAAEMAFQDICLVYAASSARPNSNGPNITLTTTPGFTNLSSCAKFALTGCYDKDGNRNEANCGPLRKWQQWEDYRGVAPYRQCTTAECLCKQPEFDASFAVAYNAGERYCGMYVSTEALPNKEYEEMQNVLATFCTSEGYPPKEWWLKVVGQLKGSNQTNTASNRSETNENEGWTLNNRLQMGLGAGIGLPSLILAAGMFWLALASHQAVQKAAKENRRGNRRAK